MGMPRKFNRNSNVKNEQPNVYLVAGGNAGRKLGKRVHNPEAGGAGRVPPDNALRVAKLDSGRRRRRGQIHGGGERRGGGGGGLTGGDKTQRQFVVDSQAKVSDAYEQYAG